MRNPEVVCRSRELAGILETHGRPEGEEVHHEGGKGRRPECGPIDLREKLALFIKAHILVVAVQFNSPAKNKVLFYHISRECLRRHVGRWQLISVRVARPSLRRG